MRQIFAKIDPVNVLIESDPNIVMLDYKFTTILEFEFFLVRPNENYFDNWKRMIAFANLQIILAKLVKFDIWFEKLLEVY